MNDRNDDRLVEAILASGVKIPPMPAVLTEVLALERDDDAGPREFAARIGLDPATSGALFRVARSPVMGLRSPVDSLEKAIKVLGLKTTVAVARTEAMRNALHDPSQKAAMATLWKRMDEVAYLTLAMMRLIRPGGIREDMLFQAAVFHDCGVAVLMRRFQDYARAFADGRWPNLRSLDRLHRTAHSVVGQLAARNWQLPDEVVQVVRHHHDHDIEDLPEPVRKMIVLIRFACHLLDADNQTEDDDWEAVWRKRTEDLLAQSGHDLVEVEQEIISARLNASP